MKIFRSYKNLLAATVFFASIAGFLALLLIDDINNLRSPLLNENFLSALIEKIGVERIDFSTKSFACFCFTYLDCLALFFTMLYSRTLEIYFRIQNRKFNLKLYYILISFFFVLIFAGSLIFLGMEPYNYLELAVIYAFFFIFFIIAAAIFFLISTLISFIYAMVTKQKFYFPTDNEISETEQNETLKALALEASQHTVFPSLLKIDEKYADLKPEKMPACNILSLKDLSEGFREYAFSRYSVNYNIASIRSFISGMAMYRLVFLRNEGEDPVRFIRIFTEYIGGILSFIQVQKEWDGDSDVLGYYSESEGQFMCSSFVEKLYETAYTEDRVNLISFTDMGAANIYEYFGAVMRALYRNVSQPRLSLMRIKKGQFNGKIPKKLADGSVHIGKNTWVLGMLGNLESEARIASDMTENFVVIGIMHSKAKITAPKRMKSLNICSDELNDMFDFASIASKFKLTVSELEIFLSVADYVYDSFNIHIDGVTVDYIQIFVACYVFCGGTKEEALDIVFLKKIFSKLKGRSEEFIANGMARLDEKIVSKYGKSGFKYTRAQIKKELNYLAQSLQKSVFD